MKIGITGIAGGGKTVFLSSLLWQLIEMESADFFLGRNLRLTDFREIRHRKGTGEPFPFERCRDSLSRQGVWPAKTVDCYRYSCDFRRSDKKKLSLGRLKELKRLRFSDRQRLELFDFPGERIADAAIASFSRYEDWCDHILEHFQSHSDYREAVEAYFELMERLTLKGERDCDEPGLAAGVTLAYKRALARLIYGYRPLISPSTFLLGRHGDTAKPLAEEALASSRAVGMDEFSQFAPISRKMREAFPELTRNLSGHFQAYRREVALPLFEEIGKSECLIVLVDIPSILAGGVGRYNDNRQIVLDLFDSLRPDSSLGALLLKVFAFWRRRLRKVAFVASKADLVQPEDIENGRLESLLRQMTSRAKRMLPEVEFGWFACSAIRSTRPGKCEGKLIGRLTHRNPLRLEKEFSVPALPEAWPDDWKAGDFRFLSVLPEVPRNLQVPPAHLGLDRLFDFLIG